MQERYEKVIDVRHKMHVRPASSIAQQLNDIKRFAHTCSLILESLDNTNIQVCFEAFNIEDFSFWESLHKIIIPRTRIKIVLIITLNDKSAQHELFDYRGGYIESIAHIIGRENYVL